MITGQRWAKPILLCLAAALRICCASSAAADGDGISTGAVPLTATVQYDENRPCLPPVIAWPELKTATLRTPAGETLDLVMDEKGAELALVMNRMQVDLIGSISTNSGKACFRFKAYADPRMEAAHEFWRRMCCADCTVDVALVNATRPRNLQGAKAIAGQPYPPRPRIGCWARDADHLWVATEREVLQFSLADRRLVRTFGKPEGLPASTIYRLFSDGRVLWIVHRDGVTTLRIADGRLSAVPDFAPNFAHIIGGNTSVWIIADSGTLRFDSTDPGAPPERADSLPTADTIRKRVEKGIWRPHWTRETRDFVRNAASVGGRLYVESLGDIYEFDGAWRRVARQGWELQAQNNAAWFIGLRGITEIDARTSRESVFAPPDVANGRYSRFLLAQTAAWVASEPSSLRAEEETGGLARLDMESREWRVWKTINGHKANHIGLLKEQDGVVWAVTMRGTWRTQSADPGMIHVQRNTFVPEQFALHRFDEKTQLWETLPLPPPPLGTRLICGHSGSSREEPLVLQSVQDLCVGPTRIFGSVRIGPAGFYSGYWPSIAGLAARPAPDAAWQADFDHHPEELGLQGEQPAILNISSSGRRILPGIGQDGVLGLFRHNGTYWIVTEGGVAFRDDSAAHWRRIYEPRFGFYWRATAAVDDGEALYIGSDRGLVSRLDLATDRIEVLAAMKDRAIAALTLRGGILQVQTQPAPPGRFPAGFQLQSDALDCDAAEFDGAAWRAVHAGDARAAATNSPPWFFQLVEKRHERDKSQGNFLWQAAKGRAKAKPRYYVKEAFFPQFLCASPDGTRLWLTTFDGIVRLDLPPGRQ